MWSCTGWHVLQHKHTSTGRGERRRHIPCSALTAPRPPFHPAQPPHSIHLILRITIAGVANSWTRVSNMLRHFPAAKPRTPSGAEKTTRNAPRACLPYRNIYFCLVHGASMQLLCLLSTALVSAATLRPALPNLTPARWLTSFPNMPCRSAQLVFYQYHGAGSVRRGWGDSTCTQRF